jgi:hypothetical protein
MSDAARAKAEALAPLFGGTPRGDAYVPALTDVLDAFATEQTAGKFVTDKVIEPQCLATGCEADVWRHREARWKEQTAALTAENERLNLKVEQYQVQLDDRWAGVVGVTNRHVEQTAALRAALKREHGHEQMPLPHAEGCDSCALLADAGQVGEEWRALNALADVVKNAQPYRLWMSLEEAYAAVEKARQR